MAEGGGWERAEIMEGKTLNGLYTLSCTGATIKGKQDAVEDWLSVYPIVLKRTLRFLISQRAVFNFQRTLPGINIRSMI